MYHPPSYSPVSLLSRRRLFIYSKDIPSAASPTTLPSTILNFSCGGGGLVPPRLSKKSMPSTSLIASYPFAISMRFPDASYTSNKGSYLASLVDAFLTSTPLGIKYSATTLCWNNLYAFCISSIGYLSILGSYQSSNFLSRIEDRFL